MNHASNWNKNCTGGDSVSNVFQPSAEKINAALSELGSTVQNSLIVNKVMIKLTCKWIIMKLRIKIMIVKVAQKMKNLLDVI